MKKYPWDKDAESVRTNCERFFRSGWFQTLTSLDGEVLIEKLHREVYGVFIRTDPAGNIKPTKAKSPEKIDGIVAAIMALDRCIRNEGQQQGSVYDERDMIVF